MNIKTETKHTPTPWNYIISANGGKLIHIETDMSNPSGAGVPICSLPRSKEANAHEELRMQAVRLETMLESIQRRSWNPSNETIAFYLKEVRDVLAKSEGK